MRVRDDKYVVGRYKNSNKVKVKRISNCIGRERKYSPYNQYKGTLKNTF